MFRKVPEASARDSGPEGSRKPRTYASSREIWKLLETVQSSCGRSCWSVLELGLVLVLLECAGAGAGAAGEGQKVLDCAGEQGSAAGLAGTVAARVL